MSISNPEELATVQVHSLGGPVRISLLDHRFRPFGEPDIGKFERQVPPGLYLLQYDTGWVSQQVPIDLEPGGSFTDLEVRVPFPSAAPIPDTFGYRPRQADAASELSLHPQSAPNGPLGIGARLMVFVRAPKVGAPAPSLAGLTLLDRGERPLIDPFPSDRSNEADGWAGWCADVAPGCYVLHWKSDDPALPVVNQALWAAAGWTTILFLVSRDDGKGPHPRNLTVHMTRLDRGFRPSAEGASATELALELALAGWRTGKALVDRASLERMLREKFEDPMLGVIAAHVLLEGMGPDRDLLKGSNKTPEILEKQAESKVLLKLLTTVLAALEEPSMIPGHPDLQALRGIVRRRFKHSEPVPLLEWPPMFKASFKGVIAGDWDGHGLICPNSLADQVAPRLVPLAPWTTWLPNETVGPDRPLAPDDAEAQFLGEWLGGVLSDLKPVEQVVRELGIDWKKTAPGDLWRRVTDSADAAVRKLAGQVQAVYRFAEKHGNLDAVRHMDLAGISRSLNLPRSSVTTAAIRLAQDLAARKRRQGAGVKGPEEVEKWPPANGLRYIRGERFGRLLLDVAERLTAKYPGQDFTDGVAQVFAWFDGRLRRNRRFINGRRFPTESAFRAYLRQAVWNAARMAARTRRKGETLQALPAERRLAASEPTPAQLASLRERVDALEEPHRTVLERMLFEEVDVDGVADLMNVSRREVVRLYEEAIDRLSL